MRLETEDGAPMTRPDFYEKMVDDESERGGHWPAPACKANKNISPVPLNTRRTPDPRYSVGGGTIPPNHERRLLRMNRTNAAYCELTEDLIPKLRCVSDIAHTWDML